MDIIEKKYCKKCRQLGIEIELKGDEEFDNGVCDDCMHFGIGKS